MKRLAVILLSILLTAACGSASSPDGRSQLRDEKIQQEIDSLKTAHKILADSIRLIDKKLTGLKK